MSNPNLFLVGAPRCGTTAMCQHLQGHAQVYMAEPKEPYYWATDFPELRKATGFDSEETYLALFRSTRANHRVIGEASTLYLASEVAISNILEFSPCAKFMIIVRNPIELAHSFYFQLRQTQNEDASSFEKAWRLQCSRADGKTVARTCSKPRQLQYREIASIGSQLERALQLVPESQLLVLWHEDMLTNFASVYHKSCSFLQIEHDGRSRIRSTNASAVDRSGHIGRLLRRSIARGLASRAKRTLPLAAVRRIQAAKNHLTARGVDRPALSVDFQRELVDVFGPEIEKLSRWSGRNLSHWTIVRSSSQ
jgi:hypothetical protein